MKLNKIALSAIALGAFALSSCSPGKYWDEPSSISPDALAFYNPSEVVQIPVDGTFPSTTTVKISRSNPDVELTIPLVEGKIKNLTAADKENLEPNQILVQQEGVDEPVVVNTPAVVYTPKSAELSTTQTEVKFPKGSYVGEIVLDVDTELVEPGYSYEATFTLALPSDVNVSEESANLKCNFTIKQEVELVWEAAGTATLTSSLVGNSTPVEVPVEVASNYPDKKYVLYRLVSPYAALDADVAEGFNIEFLCNRGSVRRAASAVEGWQQTGLTTVGEDGITENIYLGSQTDITSSFKNQNKRYILVETIGLNTRSGATSAEPVEDEDGRLVTETLSFTWNF